MTISEDPLAPIEPRDAHQVDRWDEVVDVVVVGFGCAGACAAIEAAEAGAAVLALEAAALGGGTSALSGGLIYLGGGTPVQEACGYEDSPENMAAFLRLACGPGIDEAKLTAYCEDSVGHFHWLVDHGVPFEGRYNPSTTASRPTPRGWSSAAARTPGRSTGRPRRRHGATTRPTPTPPAGS